METWKPIEDFPRYSVSDEGRVRNDLTDRIMRQSYNQTGVAFVGLMLDGRQHTRSVAVLMAEAFVEAENEFHDTPVYLDGDRTNINPSNVVYRPRWYASKYTRQFRKRYHTPIVKPIQDMDTGEVYENSWDCAIKNGLLEEQIVLGVFNNERIYITNQRFGLI